MEKKTAHYKLADVLATVAAHGLDCFTQSARQGLLAMGLTPEEALAAIAALQRRHLHKSMTTVADHKVWQDVYRCPTDRGLAYVKFTLIQPTAAVPTPRVVISFKALEDQ